MGVMGSLLLGTNVYAESYASVNVEVLNVRQNPSETAAIADTYSKNATVKIIDQVSPGWYVVETKKGNSAYVSSQYLDIFKVKAEINENDIIFKFIP